MELGLSMFGDLHIDPITGIRQSGEQRLAELIEEIKFADEIKLDVLGIGEHHREEYAISSPEIVLAAAATVTKQIKLSSSVTVLGSSDPVKLYQNFALVDLISNGRSELMAGRGSFTESFPLFGYDLSDYNALFEEKLDLFLQINSKETINWNGQFRAPLQNQKIFPRAVNNKIPVWIAAGGTRESAIRAGRLGLPIVFAVIAGTPLLHFQPLYELYREVYEKSGHDMDQFQVGMFSHGLFGDDSKTVSDYYYPLYAAQMDRIGRTRGWSPFHRNQYDFGRSKEGAMFVGDAEETIDKILYAQELYGITRFFTHMDVGAPSHLHLMKSIEIFGTKIAPKIREVLHKK